MKLIDLIQAILTPVTRRHHSAALSAKCFELWCEEMCDRLGYEQWRRRERKRVNRAANDAIRWYNTLPGRQFAGDETDLPVVRRQFLKILACELRGAEIEAAMGSLERPAKESVFTHIAAVLRPDLQHPTLGTPPGAFFDPECWPLHSDSVVNEIDTDVRLAALVSAMLCQEDGIREAESTPEALSTVIGALRMQGREGIANKLFVPPPASAVRTLRSRVAKMLKAGGWPRFHRFRY